MNDPDQLNYLKRRIAEQRGLAAKAKDADIVGFHTRLIDHYSRLLADAEQLAMPFATVARRVR